jgi:hypothetical protein
MGNLTARDITEAKRQARDDHISDDGRTTDDHIFAHVPEILGVEGWHRHPDGEWEYGKEHLWRRNDHSALVFLERTPMGWAVDGRGDLLDAAYAEFDFQSRKSAEAFLVNLMLDN